MNRILIFFLISLLALIFISCSSQLNQISKTNENEKILPESIITKIELEGKISQRDSEISGLCWYGDKLVILPQYPNNFESEFGKIFFITKNRLENYLSGLNTEKIKPDYFSINLEGFEEFFKAGSGFEAVTFKYDTAFFSIESMNFGETESIIVRGIVNVENSEIILDKSSIVKDPVNLFIHNVSDESILFHKNKVIPIYEVYGKNLNQNPKVSVFNTRLKFIRNLSFPNIEYRITDVTSVDENGRFWAMNYFYPGGRGKIKPAEDMFVNKYGIGRTHKNYEQVERIIEFKILDNEITIVDQDPIYIKLLESDSRNWEGIARFNDGFIIATDRFPETILAFVAKN